MTKGIFNGQNLNNLFKITQSLKSSDEKLASKKQSVSESLSIVFNRCVLFSKVKVETISLTLKISYKLVNLMENIFCYLY